MTRHALLLGSVFVLSCGGSPDEAPEVALEAPSAVADEPESDAYVTSLPTGAFPSIADLCAKQMDMAAPNIVEANRARAEMYEGISEESVHLGPSCVERRDVLANVTLAAPFEDVTAIEMETGYATQTFLVVRTRAGWTAVRHDFLSSDHDDPGCPSITRESDFASVRVEKGELVVAVLADRMSFDDDAEPHEIVVTLARRCSIATCSDPEEIEQHIAGR
ncbi:MAG TPA: hypothetical protein VIF62_02425 [Labilithrix sp.]|jgi:hypothetical protein